MNPTPKPGYLTTEFWTVLLSYVFSFFTGQGILNSDDARTLANGIAEVIVALIPLITTIFYIYKRSELKKTQTVKTVSEPVMSPTETM